MINPIIWQDDKLVLLDQTKLPHEETYLYLDSLEGVEKAIKVLSIRGAPNLGLAAIYGVYIGIREFSGSAEELGHEIERVCKRLAQTRPTAYDLFAALDIAKAAYKENPSIAKSKILERAHQLKAVLESKSSLIGKYGAEIVPQDSAVLTHCNTGVLAAPGNGTAFSVIAEAYRQGRIKMVYADETRPLLQGSRLTAWELERSNIPHKINVDGAAGYLMSKGMIDLVITGADRIARNGDTANKIGTYQLAVLAQYHNIPFYIAAPKNTFDKNIETGAEINVEMRSADEVRGFGGFQSASESSDCINPAFDVTPSSLITGIITEDGILKL